MLKRGAVSDWIIYQLVCILSFGLSLLPLNASFWLARQLGNLLYFCMPNRRKVTLENIQAALGQELTVKQQKKIARTAFQNAGLSIVELFLVKKIKHEARKRIRLMGNEHLEKAFSNGKGVLLVISHLVSWELLAFLPYLTDHLWSVVVKDIRNPYLNKKIDSLRREMKLMPIAKAGSIKEVLRKFRRNEGVAILTDQWAGNDGLWLDFFGRPTSTTSIPARLAKQTGCALIPAYCLRDAAGRYSINIEPQIEFNEVEKNWEVAMTGRLSRVLERQIRTYPEQWMWGHRRWKKKPAFSRAG